MSGVMYSCAVGGDPVVGIVLCPLSSTAMSQNKKLFKNPQDERAFLSVLSGLLTAFIFKRKLDATDVVASLETIIESIKENNPDVYLSTRANLDGHYKPNW
jgi:hypothetical protein